MSYVNIEEYNVNTPDNSPLKDFIIFTSGLLVSVYLLYLLSGYSIDFIIQILPQRTSILIEKKIEKLVKINKKHSIHDESQHLFLQKGLNLLTADQKELAGRNYNIYILKDKQVNAAAVPGGNIIITDSLLKTVKNNDEIYFVVAHELGHFANRDHLKLLGRKLIFIAFSTVLFGENSQTTNFILKSVEKIDLKYSQEQEYKADMYAIDLMYKKYNDTNSGINLMEMLSSRSNTSKLAYFFTSHPHPQDRISAMRNEIQKLKDLKP